MYSLQTVDHYSKRHDLENANNTAFHMGTIVREGQNARTIQLLVEVTLQLCSVDSQSSKQ
jgi:hypothetical protein